MNRQILILSICFAALPFVSNKAVSSNLSESLMVYEPHFKPVIKDWALLPNPFSIDFFDTKVDIEKELSYPLGKTKLADLNNKFYSRSQTYQPLGSETQPYLWTANEIKIMENGFLVREKKKQLKNPEYSPKTLQEYLRHLNTLYWQAKHPYEPHENQPFSHEDALRLPPYFSETRAPVIKKIPLSNENEKEAFFPVLAEPLLNQMISSDFDLIYSLEGLEKCVPLYENQRDLFNLPKDDYESYLTKCGRKEKSRVNKAYNIISPSAWGQWYNAEFDPREKIKNFCAEKFKPLAKTTRIDNPLGEDQQPVQLDPAAEELWLIAQRAKNINFKINKAVQEGKKLTMDLSSEPVSKFIEQWLGYSCADPQVANDDDVKDYVACLNFPDKVTENDKKKIITKLIQRFVHPYFKEENVACWLAQTHQVLGALVLTRLKKGVYHLPCVLTDERKWENSSDVATELLQHFFNMSPIDQPQSPSFSQDAFNETYVEHRDFYKREKLALMDLKDGIAYWRNAGYLETLFLAAVYYPLMTPKPEYKITKCVLTACQLESQWITRQKKRKNGTEICLADLPPELNDVEEVDLSRNLLHAVFNLGHSTLILPFNPTHLKRLDLSSNQIIKTHFLIDFYNLEVLCLKNNKIAAMSVPNYWTVLKKLDLSENQLMSLIFERAPKKEQPSGWWSSAQPEEPLPHQAIEVLRLENNPFEDKMFEAENSNFILLNPQAKVFIREGIQGIWKDLHTALTSTGNFNKGCSVILEEVEIPIQIESTSKRNVIESDEEDILI